MVFKSGKHVELGTVWDVAVSPGRMSPARGSRGIKKTGLSHQNHGALCMLSEAHSFFRSGDLVKASAQVHGYGSQAFAGFPWNRPVQRIIHFENGGSISILGQLTTVSP